MTRSFLRSVCRVLIGVLLMAHIAVAAYVCPGLSSGAKMVGPMSSATTLDGAVKALADAGDCAGMASAMDPAFANLCAEHCHQGQQSDQVATLTVPAAMLTALYITPLAPEPFVAPRLAAAAMSALAAASAPLAILHCCFRI